MGVDYDLYFGTYIHTVTIMAAWRRGINNNSFSVGLERSSILLTPLICMPAWRLVFSVPYHVCMMPVFGPLVG